MSVYQVKAFWGHSILILWTLTWTVWRHRPRMGVPQPATCPTFPHCKRPTHPTVTHLDAMGPWKSAVESNEKPLERPPGERVACENRRYWFNGEGEGLSQSYHLPNVHNIWIYTECRSTVSFFWFQVVPTQNIFFFSNSHFGRNPSCPISPSHLPGPCRNTWQGPNMTCSDGTRRGSDPNIPWRIAASRPHGLGNHGFHTKSPKFAFHRIDR